MPTRSFEPLLYRELAKADAKETIETASPLLQELVNYATYAFQRCQTSSTGRQDEDLPILTLYLHIIEMTDGIEVLISQSCPIPAIPLLRSSFEAQLAIDYITATQYGQRSFAWLVAYVHQRLNQYEMFDPSSQRGKQFLSALTEDGFGRFMKLPSMPDLPRAVKNLRSLVSKPDYQAVETEYQRLKKTRGREPCWYSLFGGPSSLRELAKSVSRPAQYDFLYRYWSAVTHASDLSRFLARTEEGARGFRPLRNHRVMAQVACFAASLILDGTRKALSKFRPGEEKSFATWYNQEARRRYLSVCQVNS